LRKQKNQPIYLVRHAEKLQTIKKTTNPLLTASGNQEPLLAEKLETNH
jgi:hypothetical protein